MKKRTAILICTATALCCGIMLVVVGLWQPGYLIKSLVKLGLFLLIPLLVSRLTPALSVGPLFRPRKDGLLPALGLGLGVYGLIVGGYFLLKNFIDFSGIAGNLAASTGVTRENFLLVSLYISFANSLLEEFFFRGFCFWGLKNSTNPRFAHLFSAGCFALYHTAMMAGWFDWWIFALAIFGLFVGGLIFNRLNEKQENIYTSWLTHMFANFAINTIGFMLL